MSVKHTSFKGKLDGHRARVDKKSTNSTCQLTTLIQINNIKATVFTIICSLETDCVTININIK